MTNFRLFFTFIMMILMLSCTKDQSPAEYNIIPKPVSLSEKEGHFYLDPIKKIYTSNDVFFNAATYLSDLVKQSTPFSIEQDAGQEEDDAINFILDASIESPEGYRLNVLPNKVDIYASGAAGAFYAVQSLRQLLPADFENPKNDLKKFPIPCVEIQDSPRFSYRGMHLDVGRHFFPVEFIKRYIDLMAYHKYNTFHWHLTEDQGWRIEIKKYPKLQTIAAFREETMNGHFTDKPRTFDGKKYGGFYTQEEIKEVVQYAAARSVEVIPEIEMPGHSMAALAAYPELACTPGPFKTAKTWGVLEEVYCPTEATFEFLENVLLEVIDLFPSKYIHIGGDECPKRRWKESAFCQRLMKEKGLKDEHELQSYFIQRMEKFINSKGKQIIGWDEILEGGLAPNATVMSWRGIAGGIAAAKEKHDVIMTPTTHCYFDYYQSKAEGEPIAIGGFLPIEKVYEFEPIPSELTAEEAKYILGAQCNLWTEYIRTPEYAEYMTYPRATALAETNWSPKESKNWNDFAYRLKSHLARLSAMSVNAATHFFDVKPSLDLKENGEYEINLETNDPDFPIYYTLDGSDPSEESMEYKTPVVLNTASDFKAASWNPESKKMGNSFSMTYNPHLGCGQKITLKNEPSERYPGTFGVRTLMDGVDGGKSFNAETWLGFDGEDLDMLVEFKEETEIRKAMIGTLKASDAWINLPSSVLIQASTDGSNFQEIAKLTKQNIEDMSSNQLQISFNPVKAKFLKILVKNHGVIAAGSSGAGQTGWLFVDEIRID